MCYLKKKLTKTLNAMKVKVTRLLFLLFASAITTTISAQSIPDSTIKKIDKLFAQWDNANSPGCVVGIVRNDSLIFAKGYGMANLEYGIRITPETIFHMASVSKQFTAYAIVLLAKQGKLNLDDDVRKYLPWFPDLKEKITIRHLLNHTSGIRDQWQLLAISGTRLDDVITQEHIVKILSKQQALNFKPGEQYSYSNSGYTMAAEIVKSVTGQSLRKFADSAIFKPLGMRNTHFHDDCTEIVKNRSYSYQRRDSTSFSNSILSYSNAGATSLFTNINDISRWIMNFYHPAIRDQKDIALLADKGKLNNGKETSYGLGISVEPYKGWRQYSHSGGDAGYRTYLTVFPDLKMGFAVFSNLGHLNTMAKVYDIVSLFIKDTANAKGAGMAQQIDSDKTNLKETITTRQFTGSYTSDKDKLIRDKQSADTTMPDHELQAYTGTYYCPELDCNYRIILKDHQLVITNAKYKDNPLRMAGPDQLLCDYWWMNRLAVIRNDKKEITGFEVNSGRIQHLRFNKIEQVKDQKR
jgi:CubicO group peptidase (beta-lactamase class C family)